MKSTLHFTVYLIFLWTIWDTAPLLGQDLDIGGLSSTAEINKTQRKGLKKVFYGKPGKASFWALFGGGQIYNKQYWKVPIVWGAEYFLIQNIITQQNNFQAYNSCHVDMVTMNLMSCQAQLPSGEIVTLSSTTEAFNAAENARGNVELAWVYLIAGHLVNVLDAYVSAHLLDFDTSSDLSSAFHDPYSQPAVAVIPIFKVRVPLNASR